MRHAFAAWHNGKVLPGCENYANEEGEKWTEQDFPPLLPDLEEARGFMDGAIGQYQQKETILGTSRSFADTGVRISHHVNEKHDFKGPWDTYGKESTDSRRSAVRNRTAVINNAYLHAKHNATAMARPKQVNSEAGRERGAKWRDAARCPTLPIAHYSPICMLDTRPTQEKSEARWRDYAADHYFHYYYRYGENEKGEPLADDHRKDDLLELAAVSCCVGLEPTPRHATPRHATPRHATPRAHHRRSESRL